MFDSFNNCFHISLRNEQRIKNLLLFRQVLKGDRLELHPKIPESIKMLIQLTMVDADHRPSFLDLKDNLLDIGFQDGK